MGVVCNGYMRFIDPMKINIIAILLKIIPSGALCNEPVLGEWHGDARMVFSFDGNK